MRKLKYIPILMAAMAALASAQTAAKPAAPAQAPKTAAPATAPAQKPADTGKKDAKKEAAPAKSGSMKDKVAQEEAKFKALLESNKQKPVEDKPRGGKDSVDTSKPMAKSDGRRDPFVNILAIQKATPSGAPPKPCTNDSKCLTTDQITLKGIVKTTSGMIAMIENAARKQYNLHEKDPIANGYVLKITGDSVIFRITVTDALGKPAQQDVVKRVTVPAV